MQKVLFQGLRLRNELTMTPKNYFWLVTALALARFVPGVSAQVLSGTAFAVAPGLLITNQHVIAGCSSVEVIAADGRRSGSIVDADAQIDLALLRVSGLKGATARIRYPRNIRLGESVMVFGFPLIGSLSSNGNFTSGLVSALRGFRDAAGEIQITAPVQPGNSGGPLMDSSGLVIGVVVSKLDAISTAVATGDIPQNVNFAISLEVVADFLAKNKVSVRDSAISAPVETARVAELAQSFTYRVECQSRSQQAVTTPSKKPNRLPPCPGAYQRTTWTNCVGTFTVSGGITYVGEFKRGQPHGYGTRTWPNGDKYVGEFRDGQPNGQGTHTWPDGEKHVGEFSKGQPDGQGTRYRANGVVLRSGIWEDGVYIGSR
jgi:hypothetical protein